VRGRRSGLEPDATFHRKRADLEPETRELADKGRHDLTEEQLHLLVLVEQEGDQTQRWIEGLE